MTPLWFWQDLISPREYLLQRAAEIWLYDLPWLQIDFAAIYREVRGDADRI